MATKDPTQGKLGQTGRVHTESLTAIGRVPTTWRRSTGKGYTILGMLSTLEDTISSAPVITYVITFL